MTGSRHGEGGSLSLVVVVVLVNSGLRKRKAKKMAKQTEINIISIMKSGLRKIKSLCLCCYILEKILFYYFMTHVDPTIYLTKFEWCNNIF